MLKALLDKYRPPAALIWRYGRDHRKVVFAFIGLGVLSAMTESFGVFLLVPLLETVGQRNVFANIPIFGVISDFFGALPPESRLIWAGSIMLVVVLLRGAIQLTTEYIGYSIPHRVDCDLRVRAYRILLATSMRFTDSAGAGEIGNFVIAYPARMGIALRFVAMLGSNTALLCCYILVLLAIAPVISAIGFVYVILSTLLFKRFSTPLVQRIGTDLTQAERRFAQTFYETLNGAKLIRLSGAVRIVQREVESSIRLLRSAKLRMAAVENMTVPFFNTIGGILICVLVMLVSLLPPDLASSAVGVLVIFIVLLFRILAPLSIINIARNNILIHLEAFYEFDRFLHRAEAAREVDGDQRLDKFEGAIRLEDVSFAYKDDGPDVLRRVSLEIPRGQTIALVGPSGSGKSTLINLITRLYRPKEGRVLVDGHDLAELRAEDWWRHLSVVSQEAVLINDTVRANITFGMGGDVPLERIRAAAKLAAIDEWIEEQPLGYDFVLGDRGAQLSGGQRQRMVLARAFLREPEVLILDEATSALDALTEKAVQQGIQTLTGKCTLIVIAHRLATVQRADAIAVMDAGFLVELGTHRELIERRGIYWQMLESQAIDLASDDTDASLESAEGGSVSEGR